MVALSPGREQPCAEVLSLAHGGCGLHFTTLDWPLSCTSSIQVYVALDESPAGLHWIDRWWAPNPLLLFSEIRCCVEPRRFEYWRMLAIWERSLLVADFFLAFGPGRQEIGWTDKKESWCKERTWRWRTFWRLPRGTECLISFVSEASCIPVLVLSDSPMFLH